MFEEMGCRLSRQKLSVETYEAERMPSVDRAIPQRDPILLTDFVQRRLEQRQVPKLPRVSPQNLLDAVAKLGGRREKTDGPIVFEESKVL
jgi:hypothetical protein